MPTKTELLERLDSLHERYDRQVCTAGKSQPCGDVCIPFRRNGKPIKCGDKEKSRLGFKVRSRLQRFKEGRSAKQQQLYKQYAQQKAEGANLKAKQRVEQRAARNAADYRSNRQAQRSAARQTERQAREQADYRAKREQQRNAAKETERQAREYVQSRTKQKSKTDPWASQDYSTRRGVNAGYNESADKELLGVGDVDARSLSKAYRAAARKYHPDLGGKKEQMQRVNQAYENLKKKYKLDSRLDSAIAPESGMYWVRMG